MKNKAAAKTAAPSAANETVEVLYQKLGDRWFAFSLIDDEVFFGSIGADEIKSAEASSGAAPGVSRPRKLSGNS